jgi:NADH-quinone oxidoreductase subunit M
MITFHLPWLELAVLWPLLGAIVVRRMRSPDMARRASLVVCSLALVCGVGAWSEFGSVHGIEGHDPLDVVALVRGSSLLTIDELSAPLLPLAALLYLLVVLSTLRTKVRRLSFAGLLTSEAILLATLACKEPWTIIALLAAGTVPPWLDLRAHHRSTRIYTLHMSLFVVLLIAGQTLLASGDPRFALAAIGLLMAAVLLRSGVVPVHGWMTDLFESASFATALLFVTPMVGAYAAMRLFLPIAPDWALDWVAILSLVTAVYAAGMALVQHDARRFFCYLFLSHSSLVLVGLETATPIGLTGALCVWLAVSLSMAGFGLTLRSVEARTGRLSLNEFHGLYEHTPSLAALFLVTGLASIGFPGTIGFIGTELLVDGAVQDNPLVGIAIVATGALNGLAVLYAYFRVFTGTRHKTSIDLRLRLPEHIAVLVLTALIFGGGLFPQPGVASRYEAATELVRYRQERFGELPPTADAHSPRMKSFIPDWR